MDCIYTCAQGHRTYHVLFPALSNLDLRFALTSRLCVSPITMSTPTTFNEVLECAICYEPLVIQVEDDDTDSGQPSTVPDDVLLHCRRSELMLGHHFHWACLQELSEANSWDRRICPFPGCGGNPLNQQGKLLVTVRYEGGITENFDLGAAFDEDQEESLERKHEMYGNYFTGLKYAN